MKTFDEISIGTIFTFSFDKPLNYRYEKISENHVRCVKAPKTELSSIGKIYSYQNKNSEVIVQFAAGKTFRVYGKTGVMFDKQLVYIDGLFSTKEDAEEFVEKCNKILAITPNASYRKIADFVDNYA